MEPLDSRVRKPEGVIFSGAEVHPIRNNAALYHYLLVQVTARRIQFNSQAEREKPSAVLHFGSLQFRVPRARGRRAWVRHLHLKIKYRELDWFLEIVSMRSFHLSVVLINLKSQHLHWGRGIQVLNILVQAVGSSREQCNVKINMHVLNISNLETKIFY